MNHLDARGGFDAIGVVPREVMSRTPAHWLDRLSERERWRYDRIGHLERRQRWLAGRLLAKQLFVGMLEGDGGRARVTRLELGQLGLYPAWLHRAAEVLPDRIDRFGCSHLRWAGHRHPIELSLAHTTGFTAACLSRSGAVGLDLETVCPRSESFRVGSFTRDELRWASAAAAATGEPAERAYTLLWCLKESAMKLRQSDRLNLWELPRIELRLGRPAESAAELLGYGDFLGERVATAEADVTEPGVRFTVRIAVTATRHLLLTCMRRDEGSKENSI